MIFRNPYTRDEHDFDLELIKEFGERAKKAGGLDGKVKNLPIYGLLHDTDEAIVVRTNCTVEIFPNAAKLNEKRTTKKLVAKITEDDRLLERAFGHVAVIDYIGKIKPSDYSW